MRKILKLSLVVLLFCLAMPSKAQFYSVRTNTLGWLTGSPNVGFGVVLNRNVSLDFSLMGNPIKTPQFSTQCMLAQEGMRFWFMEANIGSFLGFHFTEAVYNVGTANYLFNGWTVGFGLSYGHSWLLSKRWNIGIELGASVLYMEDKQNDRNPHFSQNAITKSSKRVMLLPTKFEVSVVYLF